MRFREASASELLMRCRKQKDDVETGGVHYSRISPGENLFTVWAASGIKVAGAADKAAIQRVRVPSC